MDRHNQKYKIYASVTTLLLAVVMVLLLRVLTLSYNAEERPEWPPVDMSELLLANEYVEVDPIILRPTTMESASGTPSDIQSDKVEMALPGSGMHTTDAGVQSSESPALATSTQSSPMKAEERHPQNPGQVEAEKALKEAEARKKRQQDSILAKVTSLTKPDRFNSDRNAVTDKSQPGGTGSGGKGGGTGVSVGNGRIGGIGAPKNITDLTPGSSVTFTIEMPSEGGRITANRIKKVQLKGLDESKPSHKYAIERCREKVLNGTIAPAANGSTAIRTTTVTFTFNK